MTAAVRAPRKHDLEVETRRGPPRQITGMLAEGDQVVLQWTSRARPRDGQPYENACIGVFTICDGQIQSVRECMDTLHARDTAFAA